MPRDSGSTASGIMLGHGTCKLVAAYLNEYNGLPRSNDYTFELSCGHSIESDEPPCFCPYCGKKVEHGREQEQQTT